MAVWLEDHAMAIRCSRTGLSSGVTSVPGVPGRFEIYDNTVDVLFVTKGSQRGTRWRVEISSQSFEELARAMVASNQLAAIKAFGAALQSVES